MRSSHPPIRTIFLKGFCTLLVLTSAIPMSARPDEPDSHSYTDFARVLKVDPIVTTQQVPISRTVCKPAPERRDHARRSRYDRPGRTILGGLLGGLVGNQFGGGGGKKVATVAGAAAGGYAGNKVQGNMQDGDTYTTTERRCNTVTDSHQNVVGYNVTYMIGDQEGKVRMDEKPGSRLPVENGQLVLN